jgi:YggT family protein
LQENELNVLRGFSLSFLGVVVGLLDVYFWIILVRALISWVNPDPYNPIIRFLVLVTEPVLRPLRRLVPPHRLGGLDLSPLLAILALEFIKNGILYSLGLGPRLLF